MKLPLCDLVTTRLGALTRVTIVDELLPARLVYSFGLLIEALLVTLGAAAAATVTVTVTGKMTTATLEVKAAMVAVRVQFATFPAAASST